MARPSKIEPFIEQAEKVLFTDINAIILTDEELVDEVNEGLKEKERITQRTFRNWKSQAIKGEYIDDNAQGFFLLLKRALREQKRNLFAKFQDDGQWQKYAWILERKFDEWNIKQKHDLQSSDGSMSPAPKTLSELYDEERESSNT